MHTLNIMFSRFSAFYSPLLATEACGFLAKQGLQAKFSVAKQPADARQGLNDGTLDLIQSAVSSSWGPLERGEHSDIVHFAQINARDGFFLAARKPDPNFKWAKLAGRNVLVDHGGQPLAMFKYACHCSGLDYSAIQAIDAGEPDAMEHAFRNGEGDYIHLQGPAPQQLEYEGLGHVVAAVGEAIGPVTFSTLAAKRDWLDSDEAHAFSDAFRKAKQHVATSSVTALARDLQQYFPTIAPAVLQQTLARYQSLGCWSAGIEIDRAAYLTALDVFEHSGLISKRHPFDTVTATPPG